MPGLLSLEQWRQEIQYHPWHYWGLGGALTPVKSSCNTIVKKYPWQVADAMGRDSLDEAIMAAEDLLAPQLGFYPAPRWVEETYQFPRHPQNDISRLGYSDSSGRWLPIRLNKTKIIAIGYQKTDLIANCVVNFSDLDGDGLKESFTVSCPTTLTNASLIKLYIQASDRYDGQGLVDEWEIRPVRVTISGGAATITGKTWLLVKPLLYEGVSVEDAIDASVLTNYVSKVDVAWKYIDPDGITYTDSQATLIWETTPYPAWCSVTSGTNDPAAVAYAIARVGIRDADNGIVTISEAQYNTGTWYGIPWYDSTNLFRPPDRVKIRYLSGMPLDNSGKMIKSMASIDAHLAAALAPRRLCACEESNRELYHWQFDLARTSGAAGESYGAISAADLNNPFGTRRGQVAAWKAIRPLRSLRGFSL